MTTIEQWAASGAMAGLVREFGGSVAGAAPEDLLDYLDAFAASHWDFRAGGERNLASIPVFPARRESIIQSAADELGLASNAPPTRYAYDAVLMTGGMVRAAIVKPRYVRELVEAGLDARNIVFLGAFRPFAGDEAEVAASLKVAGLDESDAMASGLDAAFGPLSEPAVEGSGQDNNPFLRWCEWTWRRGDVAMRVLAAPSMRPTRRANTADTFRFWARRHAEATRSVLVVTTPVYVPYQNAVAIEVLGLEYGLSVETVAVSESANDLGRDSQVFGSSHKLQELRSAIHGMRSLRRALQDRIAPS